MSRFSERVIVTELDKAGLAMLRITAQSMILDLLRFLIGKPWTLISPSLAMPLPQRPSDKQQSPTPPVL
jgi:hypothetical protein